MARNNLAYKIKVTLKGSKPPIWRRFVVPGYYQMDELHYVIQTVMGWDDQHLHAFKVGTRDIGPAEDAELDDMDEETDVCLSDCLKQGTRFEYIYDFGDTWIHDCVVEETCPIDDEKDAAPYCVAGERACPPEDSGGLYGYYEKLKILKNPKSPYYAETLSWMGKDFDPDSFNVDAVNDALASLMDDYDEDYDNEEPPWAAEISANVAIAVANHLGLPVETIAHRILENPDSPEIIKAIQASRTPQLESLMLGLNALMAENVDSAMETADRALELDPTNTDAQLVKLLSLEPNHPEYLQRARNIAQTAREKCLVDLVAKVNEESLEHYRYYPFFRAEQHLIYTLAETGELDEAMRRCEFFLALNPPDTKTVSAIFLILLIRARRFERAQQVLENVEELDAALAWLDILIAVARGDLLAARRLLTTARAIDPNVETLLVSGLKENDVEDSLSLDSLMCWTTIHRIWEEVPGAIAWLRQQRKK